jgi:hypothetical protein
MNEINEIERLIQEVINIQSHIIELTANNTKMSFENESLLTELETTRAINHKLMETLKEKDDSNAVSEYSVLTTKYINLINSLYQQNVEVCKIQKISYEMDVILQQKRNLERDVHLLKTENERLSFQLRRFGSK